MRIVSNGVQPYIVQTGVDTDGETQEEVTTFRMKLFLPLKPFLNENATVWGTTSQSSTYAGSVPEFAIDGLLNSWTHTNEETDPWWRVDLLKVYRVNRVSITNRHSNAARINGAVICIGNFLDIYSNPICGVISTLAASAAVNFSCGGMEGRYMVVHIPGNLKIVSLCEVGVYGYLAGNLAAGEAATQSSTSADWSAEKAIDGNRGLQQLYTGCSSTLNETNPWWRLDLRHVYRVSRVVITNRKDCCAERLNGAEIHIGNSLENNGSNNPICAVIPAIPAGESYSYSCNGMDGRYVNLIIPGDMKILALCEVEVYGDGPVLKRSFVKMQFNSRVDLTDPSMRENVLKQERILRILQLVCISFTFPVLLGVGSAPAFIFRQDLQTSATLRIVLWTGPTPKNFIISLLPESFW
ncbi:uncharacterized protein [Chanodichthys erythropterus]|uniref:uncharacterized protein n=1 Tax=Chanodichthys erythropterus TaxID=933992 RepID=UPI00351F69CA